MIEEDFRRSRRRNGEGSIYQRQKDGLWVGAAYVLTSAGVHRRKVDPPRRATSATAALNPSV